MNAQELIKNILQQCKIDALSTKDLVQELTELYGKVGQLEIDLKNCQGYYKEEKSKFEQSQKELNMYKIEFVTPLIENKKIKDELAKEKFKFEVEKTYKDREITIYQEILKTVTSSISNSENYYGGNNGSNWNKSQNVDKPSMPNVDSKIKFGE